MNNEFEEEQKLREEFKKFLINLSKIDFFTEEEQEKCYSNLENIYKKNQNDKNFRHYYSDIFYVLKNIKDENSGNIQNLCQNLDILINEYKRKDNKDIYNSIKKLFDHVNLDVARLEYFDQKYAEVKKQIEENEIDGKIDFIKKQVNKLESTYNDLRNKIDNSQKEYIAILGIFAGIVMAFFGGMSFSISAFNNIDKIDINEFTIFVLINGIVLVNVFLALFGFIKTLTDKESKWFNFAIISANIIFCILIYFLK